MRCRGVGSAWLLMQAKGATWTFHGLPVGPWTSRDRAVAVACPSTQRLVPGVAQERVIEHHAPAAHRAGQGLEHPVERIVALDAAPPSSVRRQGIGRSLARCAATGVVGSGDASCSVSASAERICGSSNSIQPRSPWPNAVRCWDHQRLESDRLLPDHGEQGVFCSRPRASSRGTRAARRRSMACTEPTEVSGEDLQMFQQPDAARFEELGQGSPGAAQLLPVCRGSVELQAKVPEACGPPKSDRGNDDSARWPLELSIDASRSG